MFALRHAIVCLSINLLAAGSLSAAMLVVTNPSFEASTGYNGGATSAVPGWTAFSGGTFGMVTNSTGQFTSGLTGNNAIYLNGGIAQTLSTTFVTGATYTFSLDVGNPTGIASATNATVQFGFRNAADNAYLAFGFVSTAQLAAIPDGTFQTFSFTYTATAADNGNAVRLATQDFFASDATSYRLDNVIVNSSVVPEPSTYACSLGGLAFIAFAAARRRHQQRAL